MKLERDQVRTVVLQALKEDQEAILEEPTEIGEDSRPLECLNGFDSLASVMVTQRCFEVLGLKAKEITVFVGKNEEGKLIARTLREVIDYVMTLE